ncbi:hypothetical protein [Rhodococcus sp. USK13]|uniref:hypothetical protein n=1 Tax=Rhodococcus sp. USK13 TaxID=2806442 RepID=UPI001BCF9849|nr:hypothetical protein [Rhodococcus sp. USK13]
MVDVDVLGGHPGTAQRIDLMVGVLVCAGDACVADQHLSTIPRRGVSRHSFPARVIDALEVVNVLFRAGVGTGKGSAEILLTEPHGTPGDPPRLPFSLS